MIDSAPPSRPPGTAPLHLDEQSTVPSTMSVLEALLVIGVGFLAGTINTIVGSGSLITFPTLLAIGYSPVVANVSNTIGITFGSVSGAVGYRRELGGQRRRTVVLGSASLIGGTTGGVLLLTLPSSVFDDVVPVLILGAVVLVILQPRLSRLVAERRTRTVEHGGFELWIGIFLTGIYGGYFGAAQGVILLSLLGIFIADSLQRLNAVKNVLALVANGVAAVLFVFFAHVAWLVVVLIAVGSVVGAQLGATVGRRLPAPALRGLIVVVGLVAAIKLLVS
jgi:uncharacterized membrane protein YfcA